MPACKLRESVCFFALMSGVERACVFLRPINARASAHRQASASTGLGRIARMLASFQAICKALLSLYAFACRASVPEAGSLSLSDAAAGAKPAAWYAVFLFRLRLVPGGIGVISGHGLCNFGGVGSEVLFVNSSGLVDNESHHARGAVLRRIGHEGESPCHLPVDDIVLRSARGMRSLASEDAGKIATEWDQAGTRRRGVCLRARGGGDDWAYELLSGAAQNLFR